MTDRDGGVKIAHVEWLAPPADLLLAPGDVHVWLLDLDAAVPGEASATLSADERARASAFRLPYLAQRYTSAHAALRAILSRYTSIPPGDLAFDVSTTGKPALAPVADGPTVAFNLSHSDAIGVCAVTAGRPVGIDIEVLKDDVESPGLTDRSFSVHERATLQGLEGSQRRAATYRCWTRKEAFLKARGDGLTVPLHLFDVSCAPGDLPRLLGARAAAKDDRAWTFADLGPMEGCVGAVVTEGTDLHISRWRWTWSTGARG